MNRKRVKENDIVKPALLIIKKHPGISTSELIIELQKIVQLYPGDKEILKGRQDNKFSQIVINLISHINTNKFGKCVYQKYEDNKNALYINEVGKKEINGYKKKQIKEEEEDNLLQTDIRESLAYVKNIDLVKADERTPIKLESKKICNYKIDSRIAKTVLKNNNYLCEISKKTGKKHNTFITNDKVQYMEGHHLIPMKAQKDFKVNIDRSDNICCLCPNCHKAIHYGTIKEKKDRLKILYQEKIKKLNKVGIFIEFEDLINKYYI